MDETETRRLARLTPLACAAVVVETPEGDQSIGTAFHVGENVYLTARHVLGGNRVLEVLPLCGGTLFESELKVMVPTLSTLYGLNGETPIWSIHHDQPALSEGPFYHPDPDIDVAAFRMRGLDVNTPHLVLGGHYDDWIKDEEWMLTRATVFGFPPIPFTVEPILVAASVEVNAVINTSLDRYVRFVVSGPPRGGFSGGPVYHEWGFVLGMTIQSLEREDARREGGFFTVLGIEALRECLEAHGLLPDHQRIDS